MKHPKLYDRVVKLGGKLLAATEGVLDGFAARDFGAKGFGVQNPFTARSRGEARMAGLIGPYGSYRGNSTRQWDKYVQVQHYRSWVARCVEFLAEGVRMPPEVVKVTASGERERYGVATKQWKQKGYVGDGPGKRKFLSDLKTKAAVGPIKSHEEYEYLPDDHPAVRLVNDPNEPQTGVKFWQLCGTYEELTGESFIWVVENGAGVPVELWCLPSQWVTPRNNGLTGKMVDWFEVRSVNGPVEVFDPAEIIWSKNDSPWHPLFTTSRVQTASTTIDAYNMTEVARYTGLENGTMAGGSITMPADVQTDQSIIDRLEARFLAKNAGVANAGRPLILEGGLQWTPPSGEMELAFMQSEDQLRKYIMAHFGLDESMMGFANHSTYAAAIITEQSLFKRVFGPRLENRAATITERLLPRFGPNLRAIYLPNTTTEDPDAKRADWQVAVSQRAVTQNEIRTELLGIEPIDDPSADELPSDPMASLTGDMSGWDAEPGQDKPDPQVNGVPRPAIAQFGAGLEPSKGLASGIINRLPDPVFKAAELNGKH